jgi:cytochrome c2
MTLVLQPLRMIVAFCFDSLRSVRLQGQIRTFATLVGTMLVLLAVTMTASENAMASPEAKALLKTKACGSCHFIPGVKGAYGKAGPALKGLSKRVRIVGGTLQNNTKNLKAWLKNPKSIKPGTLMPNMGLSDEEIEIVVKYLNTL